MKEDKTDIDFNSIPRDSGCYLFFDDKKIIYIGKAKNLKKRVKSYFQKKDFDTKTEILISHIERVEYIITTNEAEALILENTLIKKHNPKYNIDLKDAKRYAFIKLSDDKFPRFSIARKRENDGKYFGPFVLGFQRDRILSVLNRIFKLRTCKRLPKKPCLRYHLDTCSAPCIHKINESEYNTRIRRAAMVIKGNIKELIIGLKKEMKNASDDLNFEWALELKNQIASLNALQTRQNMDRGKKYNEDIINYIQDKNIVYLMLFNIHKGVLENRQVFELENTELFLEEFILKYYTENNIPKEIILPKLPDKLIIEHLEKLKSGKIIFKIPQRGQKSTLLKLVYKNIERMYFGNIKELEDLQEQLYLQEIPNIIECFDISHIAGTATVASMVQFRNGIPYKKEYRKYKIKTVNKIDDFKSIEEVVRRRYSRLQREGKDMPDLIVIDGGKGQLNAALKIMQEIDPEIPVISLAKQFEEVFLPGLTEPLRLSKKTNALKLLIKIRDEAHRFAITYNKLLRKKKQLGIR